MLLQGVRAGSNFNTKLIFLCACGLHGKCQGSSLAAVNSTDGSCTIQGRRLIQRNRSIHPGAIKAPLSQLAQPGNENVWPRLREYWYTWKSVMIPIKVHAEPYTKDTHHICYTRVRCDRPHIGAGRKGFVSYWLLAMFVPIGTLLLLINGEQYMFESKESLRYRNLEIKPYAAFAALAGSISANACVGMCTQFTLSVSLTGRSFLFTITILLATFCNIATFHFACVEFALPDAYATPFMHCISMVYMVLCYIVKDGLATCRVLLDPRHEDTEFNHLYCALIFVVCGFAPRDFALFVWLCTYMKNYWYSFCFWGDTTGAAILPVYSYFYPIIFNMLVFSTLTLFTPYSRDRRIVATIGYFSTTAVSFGQVANSDFWSDSAYGPTELIGDLGRRMFLLFILAIVVCLLMRYQRVLPYQLHKAKYVRLGFLFRMRREGRKIVRCQDTPDFAYGNPAKATYLIIVSHRWLDRYTCDVTTESYPDGFRLASMCDKLEEFFPSTCPSVSSIRCSPVSTVIAALRSALFSSHDVLVFFDFMSLPQIGQQPDGTLITRTASETTLFEEVLPAMGVLYTMYPVLVCPEVVEGLPPYSSSGWCFCEWEQAYLYGKLKQYNSGHEFPEMENDFRNLKTMSLTVSKFRHGVSEQDITAEHMDAFDRNLEDKVFFFETDREVVRQIVRGTLLRRMLVDAVIEQNADSVQSLLGQLEEHGLKGTVSQAVDHDSLDTLLHIAMRLPCKAIVSALIDFGADTECPNIRGDTPSQFFMVPRSWLPCLSRYSKQQEHGGIL